jgi:hypothetical protein
MTGDPIPDSNHIARLCKPKTLNRDRELTGASFLLEREGERSLSVNWLESLNCSNRREEIAELQRIYLRKFDRVPTNGKIAVLNVGEVWRKVLTESTDKRDIQVLHDPEDIDDSHSGIYNLRYNEVEIAELICQAVQEEYPSKSL